MKLIFSKTNEIVMEYARRKRYQPREYAYVHYPQQVRDRGNCEIVLLYGWDYDKPWAALEISIMLQRSNNRLMGERENVPSFIWNEFKVIENKYYRDPTILPIEREVVYLNRFDILDI